MIRGLATAIGLALRLAGLALVAYLVYVAVRGSRTLVWPGVRPLAPAEPGQPADPGDLGLPFETVRFTTDDGVTLAGWFVPAARETDTAVVVLHGYSGHRLPELAGFVPWLRERHHVLQFDFRGHGQSDLGPVTMGARERRDIAAAVAFLRARGIGPVALFGVSMGASAAILAAPELPVSAVVADAPYAHTRHPIANRMREQGWPMPAVGSVAIVAGASLRTRTVLPDPITAVASVSPRALLVIVSEADRLIRLREGLALYEAAGEPKEIYVVGGAAHGEAYITDPDTYQARVLGFLERYLA